MPELDHYSRSYVEHTQGQVDEAGRENLERLRKQAEEIAAGSAASIWLQQKLGAGYRRGTCRVPRESRPAEHSDQNRKSKRKRPRLAQKPKRIVGNSPRSSVRR